MPGRPARGGLLAVRISPPEGSATQDEWCALEPAEMGCTHTAKGWRCGFCDECKARGWEARLIAVQHFVGPLTENSRASGVDHDCPDIRLPEDGPPNRKRS
jgi:hypothetical protein